MKLRQSLFWDVRALLRTCGKDAIRRTVKRSRILSPKTEALWRLLAREP
jgi:hypothetical protein